jgi:hypothetical protein
MFDIVVLAQCVWCTRLMIQVSGSHCRTSSLSLILPRMIAQSSATSRSMTFQMLRMVKDGKLILDILISFLHSLLQRHLRCNGDLINWNSAVWQWTLLQLPVQNLGVNTSLFLRHTVLLLVFIFQFFSWPSVHSCHPWQLSYRVFTPAASCQVSNATVFFYFSFHSYVCFFILQTMSVMELWTVDIMLSISVTHV